MRRVSWMAVLAVACGFPSIPNARVYRGDHIVLTADPSLPVCASSLSAADAFIADAAALLGVSPPEVSYSLYDDSGAPGSCHLVGGRGDCSQGDEVWASDWVQFHELVHVVSSSWGRPPAFLVEGLAEALGTPYPQLTLEQRQIANLESILESVEFFAAIGQPSSPYAPAPDSYQIAADFVGWLLRSAGVSRFQQLYTSLDYLDDGVTIHQAFARAIGESIEDAIAAWRSHVPAFSEAPAFPLDTIRCGAPVTVPASDGAVGAAESVDCATGVTARGARIDQPIVHSFDVPSAGLFRFDTSISGGVSPILLGAVASCGPSDAPVHTTAFATPGESTTWIAPLQAGAHTIALRASQTQSGEIDGSPLPSGVAWKISPLGPEAGTCSAAPAIAPPDGGIASLYFDSDPALWPGRGTDSALGAVAVSFVRVDLDATWHGATLFWEDTGAGSVRGCFGSCDAPVGCVTLGPTSASVNVTIESPGPFFLELHAPATADRFGFVIDVRP